MRVVIRVDMRDIDDAKMIEMRKAIEALVKTVPGTNIDVTMMSR